MLFYTNVIFQMHIINNKVLLDFITGLPKSIYSFITTFIVTNLLKMLSDSKSELVKVIKMRRKYDNYIYNQWKNV